MFRSARNTLKNLLRRKEAVPYSVEWYCEEEKKKGCSPAAADMVARKFHHGKITQQEALSLTDYLCYCNNVNELRKRFSVSYKPDGTDFFVRMEPEDIIYGAMFGDIAGSIYEGKRVMECPPLNITDRNRMTDDSLLTLATWEVLESGEKPGYFSRKIRTRDIKRESAYPIAHNPFTEAYRETVMKYPHAGYGGNFYGWATGDSSDPYGSLGNGSAMRVSPAGALLHDQKKVIEWAAISAMATHNHVEGVKGAVVTAMCIWMAKKGYSKDQVFQYMKYHYSYGTCLFKDFSFEEGRSIPDHQVECTFSVPAAVIAFHESTSYEDAIQKAICIGRDTDTNACICGGIAAAYYGVSYCGNVKETVEEKMKAQLIH